MDRLLDRGSSGWILVVGFVLLAAGLTAEPQSDTDPGQLPSLPGSGRSQSSVPGYGTADSNGRMIAVTGVDVTGGSLLYLVDTESRQLAVYQANGGSQSTMSVRFVGGRNIDLDLQVDGYNDKSEYSYKQLAELFSKTAGEPPKNLK